MILFLDYDGVLHPDAAYYVPSRKSAHVELRAEGALFMWMPILEEILAPIQRCEDCAIDFMGPRAWFRKGERLSFAGAAEPRHWGNVALEDGKVQGRFAPRA